MTQSLAPHSGTHFAATDLGPQAGLLAYQFVTPNGFAVPGKVFLRETLGATGVEISWNSFPPGAGMPFLHAHREHEEVYLFTGGEGEFQVDGEIFPVREGSAVRVSPAGARAYRNTGNTPLHFIVLQVRPNSISGGSIEDGIPLAAALNWPSRKPVVAL